jgi:hypothetical protein
MVRKNYMQVFLLHIQLTLLHMQLTLLHIQLPLLHMQLALLHIQLPLLHMQLALLHMQLPLLHIQLPRLLKGHTPPFGAPPSKKKKGVGALECLNSDFFVCTVFCLLSMNILYLVKL